MASLYLGALSWINKTMRAAVTSTEYDLRLERWPVVLQLSCAWTLGIITVTLMPIEISALMNRLGWSEGAASGIAGVQIVGIVIACLVMPRLASLVTRPVLLALLLCLCGAQVATASATSLPLLASMRLCVGLCEGTMIVLVGACLARHHNAELLWGKIIFLSGVLAAGTLTALANLPTQLQSRGVWFGLGGVEIMLGMVALNLPALARARKSHTTLAAKPKSSCAVWTAWGVLIAVYTVQSGQWAVAGLHGEHQGMSAAEIGLMLALSSLLGFAGSVATALDVVRRARVLAAVGAITIMAGAVVWFFGSSGVRNFFLSQLILNVAFNGITPLLNALITQRDTDGSLLSRSVVIAFSAASIGTIGAGELLSSAGPVQFSHIAALMLVGSLPLAAITMRRDRGRRFSE